MNFEDRSARRERIRLRELYKEFLGEPNPHLALELLHTACQAGKPFRIAKQTYANRFPPRPKGAAVFL